MGTGLFCQKCGELNDSQAQFCRKCGAPQTGAAPVVPATSAVPAINAAATTPAYDSRGTLTPSPVPPPQMGGIPFVGSQAPDIGGMFRGYGGFWIRFVAVLIDSVLLSIILIPLLGVVFVVMGAAGSLASASRDPEAAAAAMAAMMPVIMLSWLLMIGGYWLYEALLTSSSKQGTLGKMALGLKVVDKDGNRLSFVHATGRHFAKIISGIPIYIGFIIAGFTERKQALHDMIAGTYVVKS